MFFVAGASLFHFGALVVERRSSASAVRPARLPARADPGLARPVGRPARHRLPHDPGPAGARLGWAHRARAWARASCAGGLYLPNACNDFIFAIIGEEFGLIGAGLVVALFVLLAYPGIRTALRAPDTFGALLAAGITAWLCVQAFINIGVVVALFPITGITLPFISAGGSSLLVSFAAVGILLSISRETVERGHLERCGC